jgi:hypothetical protein
MAEQLENHMVLGDYFEEPEDEPEDDYENDVGYCIDREESE